MQRNEGFTLIEVLASIVLISLLFLSFFSLFPHISFLNDKTAENLTAATVAKEIHAELKQQTYTYSPTQPITIINSTPPTVDGNIVRYQGSYRGFDVTIEIDGNKIFSGQTVELTQVHVKVYDQKARPIDETTNPLSETYGYVEVSNNEE
ncbi:prepilin-type N-terminal cleavage/methylation domain-containing protein [Paenisporosarcina cavernae]|uniref:Prepilin-type N-terminal cleavage/methylation domain-containing protein n=1 Tax=Paenisporosarcina cavernae TaxID=2320858 RepID=A0A385YV18_9BACL|nr:prepilin-type N-terminal cleavage/methylation domain-containing protein [Paenisporosarcina cavernae]AYC29757.1 prepilin-type N-terminal cleavage/methylation domain-containing protein [Paenisporosarcina cavernae]